MKICKNDPNEGSKYSFKYRKYGGSKVHLLIKWYIFKILWLEVGQFIGVKEGYMGDFVEQCLSNWWSKNKLKEWHVIPSYLVGSILLEYIQSRGI